MSFSLHKAVIPSITNFETSLPMNHDQVRIKRPRTTSPVGRCGAKRNIPVASITIDALSSRVWEMNRVYLSTQIVCILPSSYRHYQSVQLCSSQPPAFLTRSHIHHETTMPLLFLKRPMKSAASKFLQHPTTNPQIHPTHHQTPSPPAPPTPPSKAEAPT